MTQSALVMYTPDICGNCILCSLKKDEYVCSWAFIESNGRIINRLVKLGQQRPSWCPLKTIPERKIDYTFECDELENAYMNGWNACIDKILG